MATFQGFQPQYRQNLQDFANDPLKSSFFNTQLNMSNAQNRQSFQSRNNAFLQNMQAGGSVGNLPAYAQSQLQQNQRGLSADNSNSFNNLLLGANQLRFGATGQMGGYRPLQTGGTQTQQQSGLGSWLPQVAGAAMKIGAGFATGGASGLMDFTGATSGAFSSSPWGQGYGAATNAQNAGNIGSMNTYQNYDSTWQ
jgi:hypothetical protein